MSKTKTTIIDAPEEFCGFTEPSQILTAWLKEATSTPLRDANAMVLSTLGKDGSPQSRVVLCKEILGDSVFFFTNYESNKGSEILNTEKVALNFFWDPLARQVRLNGRARRTDRQKSVEYWNSRPRGSQLSGYASHQSKPVNSRQEMLNQLTAIEKQFEGQPVPCPQNWGGYEVSIELYEFWVGRPNRFHDRFRFTKVGDAWQAERLYP